MIFRFIKNNIFNIIIIILLFTHIFIIQKYAIFKIDDDSEGGNGNPKKFKFRPTASMMSPDGSTLDPNNYGNYFDFNQLSMMASNHPYSLMTDFKDTNLKELPQVCKYAGLHGSNSGINQQANNEWLQKCEGKDYYQPVVTQTPVLDVDNMNYSIKTDSELRAKFAYAPANYSQEPIVTILTPYYNIGPVLHETAASIFRQSLQAFQWILVNDGSPNKTLAAEMLGFYRNLNDSRITILDLEKNMGLPGARNEGLKLARGKYLLLLDPDDLIEFTYLEKAVWFLETHPQYSLVNGWSLGFGHKEYYWQKGFQNGDINLKENYITVASVMKTEVLRKVGGFDAKLRTGMEDWDLWMRMADNGHWGHTLEEFFFWYRVSPPGKWASIYNETKFNEFMSNQKAKYKNAFTKGVPKLSRSPQEKMESVENVITVSNVLRKCRPRILLILPYMEIGGADQFNYNFAQGLVLDGWEVSIACNKEAANKWLPQFLRVTPDIFIMPRFLRITDQTRFLVYLIKSRQFDIVYVSNSESAYNFLPYLRAHAPGPAYVDYTHSETPGWKNGGYARYSVGAEPLLDRSIFASEHLRQYCVERGHNPNKTVTVLIGIDSDKYHPIPENKQLVRKEMGFPDDVLLIAYVSRLEHEKQPLMFAEVLKRVHELGYDFRAMAIGGGNMFDQLNETLHRDGIQDKVKMLGSVSNKEVQRYVSGSDVFFLPSKIEGISLAIYEAMSMQVCAVSAKVGGQAELVTPDVGYLVKPGSPTETEEYTDILAELASNRSLALELGKRSRERVLNGFSVKDTIIKLKHEFCNAAIVSRLTNPIFDNDMMRRVATEVAILGFEYHRAHDELLPLWNEHVALNKRCQPPAPPKITKGERPECPYPIYTPEEVLESINLEKLRSVDDVFHEKKTIDNKLKIILKDYQETPSRKNPKVAIEKFKHNDFLHKYNHDVDDWDDDIPYVFANQEYVAYIPDAFISSGDSGTVFDWERKFTLRREQKTVFNPPPEEINKCQVIRANKIFSLLQLYFSFGNFLQEQLPKLTLMWDELEKDQEIKVLVPNIPYSKVIMEELLKLPAERILYFNPGAGWNPCTVYYANTVMLPMPTPTGHPPREMMGALRKIITRQASIKTNLDGTPISDNNFVHHFKPPKREKVIIYASRSGTPSPLRKVSNEAEVISTIEELVKPMGYRLVIWQGEELMNSTIVELASKATMLIGMTGSNLMPMLAMQKHSIVIEVMHENPWLTWWATSESLEHQHWMIPLVNSGTSHDSETIPIPIDLLKSTILQSLNETKN